MSAARTSQTLPIVLGATTRSTYRSGLLSLRRNVTPFTRLWPLASTNRRGRMTEALGVLGVIIVLAGAAYVGVKLGNAIEEWKDG